jgi:hypothetical protein
MKAMAIVPSAFCLGTLQIFLRHTFHSRVPDKSPWCAVTITIFYHIPTSSDLCLLIH